MRSNGAIYWRVFGGDVTVKVSLTNQEQSRPIVARVFQPVAVTTYNHFKTFGVDPPKPNDRRSWRSAQSRQTPSQSKPSRYGLSLPQAQPVMHLSRLTRFICRIFRTPYRPGRVGAGSAGEGKLAWIERPSFASGTYSRLR